ncbi:3-hydroxyacyl-CoA dehydrogenase [Ideonella livida]|uniref:3-hydroxyacyl-CoA dehydrogenase n=1 Tax=Ideonella livida TaxID=2707176 RepID=A0A7C9TJY2_9BURK|nr:3-hydroxyacyl-CoA dehydrogenase [Ideonella livida]NDY91364.1 3-hydroxyacyl-CoA dehydrogenase [Ideonella livida]
MTLSQRPVLVVGAGIMGAGIAQVAAQAGHPVALVDARAGAAASAIDKLATTLQGLVAKGKLSAEALQATLARLQPADSVAQGVAALASAGGVALVVEAIVENLAAKRSLFAELEGLVAPDCVLATNTSSISVTAIANGLQHPGRLVGMHFFNPVPLMKLVEVVAGLHTEAPVAEAIYALSQAWGKTPVHAKSTPGFIVNRIARPYYAETLALLQEQAATPTVLDACLRGAGFRMGPCELMDLIGHDTNFAVTNSVYEANFFDKRFQPSGVQRELVDGGLLGKKSGRGFYDHRTGALPTVPAATPVSLADVNPQAAAVSLHGRGPVAERLAAALQAAGQAVLAVPDADWVGLQVSLPAGPAQLRLSDGRPASQIAAELGLADLAVFDLPTAQTAPCAALAWAPAARASAAWQAQAPRWLALLGFNPQRLADAPGLAVARTLAMLINEASDAVHQGVCTEAGADAAMKLGVNYPAGPFEWLAGWDAPAVVALLDALDAHYRGERYRVCPGLRQRLWAPATPELAA